MSAPHETAEFRNAATYVVTIRFTVAGGARVRTAEDRAGRVASRLASAAARSKGVVDVRAVAGLASSTDVWKQLIADRVHFEAANSGHRGGDQPGVLDRYLDPEHERALRSLGDANAAYRARQDADRQRRLAVGCGNYSTYALQRLSCRCVYCAAGEHLAAWRAHVQSGPHRFNELRCLCGEHLVDAPGDRCAGHTRAELVVLEGDAAALVELGRLAREAGAGYATGGER